VANRSKIALLSAMLVAGCSGNGNGGRDYTRVPVTVAGVTYDWPYDKKAGAGDPKGWEKLHVAFFPKSLWNETVGIVPSMRFPQADGYYAIYLNPAKSRQWNIQPNGQGLPDGIRLSEAKPDGNAIVGKDDRPEFANPPTIVIFKGDPEAYATCLGPNGPNPLCILYMNDRGVIHTLTMGWGKWGDAPAALKLYRHAISAPDPTS
jgi:hypothetical protein